MSRFGHLFTLALLAVVLAADHGLPEALVAAANSADIPGWDELIKAGEAWAEEGNSKEKAESIIEAITKAADAPHNIFSGVRVFATSLRTAADKDEAALKKALGMRNNFLKATGRFTKKVEVEAHAQAEQQEAKKQADLEASAPKTPTKGPEPKYQSFFPDYKDLKATSKDDNKAFFDKIGAMAASGENGVKTLKDKTGKVVLHYVVHESGTGTDAPKAGTQCDCNYKGVTIDGAQFDSSFDRGSPTAFAPNQVIKGWTEALQQMVEGDMWEMYIPAENGYGDRGAGGKIPGGATLVFVMRLEKIKGEKQTRAEL